MLSCYVCMLSHRLFCILYTPLKHESAAAATTTTKAKSRESSVQRKEKKRNFQWLMQWCRCVFSLHWKLFSVLLRTRKKNKKTFVFILATVGPPETNNVQRKDWRNFKSEMKIPKIHSAHSRAFLTSLAHYSRVALCAVPSVGYHRLATVAVSL